MEVELVNKAGEAVAVALVDDADHALVESRKWVLYRNRTKRYAYAWEDGRYLIMHRVILDLHPGDPRESDHISGDGLDNRRSNLRIVTQAQNMQNMRSRNPSGLRGANFNRNTGFWHARAKLNRKDHFLGQFATAEEAGRVAAEWRTRNMPFAVAR